MSMHQITWESWHLSEEEDQRFQRILLRTVLPILVLMVVITFITLPERKHEEQTYTPPRYAELLPPPPPPVEQPKPELPKVPQAAPQPVPPKPQQKPKPTEPTPEQKQQVAKEQAAKAAKAFDQLSDLRNQTLLDNTAVGETTTNVITSQGATGAPPPAFVASATQGSGGIGKSNALSGNGPGTSLGSHGTGKVHGSGLSGLRMPGPGEGNGGRSFEQIQRVFDASLGSFYAIFNRAARENPAIGAGKIIVDLTIAPDGTVTDCKMVSSTFGDEELEKKIIARVRLLNFGAKAVPVFHYPNYPINYLPPS